MDVRILSQTVRNFGGCDKHSVYKATLRIESLKNLAFKKKIISTNQGAAKKNCVHGGEKILEKNSRYGIARVEARRLAKYLISTMKIIVPKYHRLLWRVQVAALPNLEM